MRLVYLLALLALVLQGCGHRGPLTLPAQPPAPTQQEKQP